MITNDTLFANVSELAAQIRARKLSPVELTEAYLQRLETVGKRLNAVAYVMRESALREAREAEAEIKRGRYRGPLHGIPYGVKDLCATREAPTTWGATPYKDQRFDYDATVVTRLREAGAILTAKLAMIELAGGMGYNQADASWTGACRTPWNTAFWSGGSSSGPGAATASACVAFAIGSETSGSIITPSAFCGVSGLRPTYGAVSRHGAMALSWTLDKLGPMCRSASDCGIVLNALAGQDPLDPTSRSHAHLPRYSAEGKLLHARRAKRLRVGVMKDSYEKAQGEVRQNFLASLDVLRRFADVEMDVSLPKFTYGPAAN
jgi:aspartyl-tRNA(Asn)/glutamyl-tRNA(Gln) amidotransferase subunit A